jgi:endo-1,4-beta-xylanase
MVMISKNKNLILSCALILMIFFAGCAKKEQKPDTLKDAFSGKFTIGAALNTTQVSGNEPQAIELVKQHFNSIVAENCMKMMYLQPQKGTFFFDEADEFVEFGEQNNMQIIGHTLIWHSQAPSWLFLDDDGNEVSRDELIQRMRDHIFTVVKRYKGRIHGWDVVNEAILDDGTWRQSKWYQIIGPEFVQLAFEFAHEADPDVELYYNDYNVERPEKRDGIYDLAKTLIDNGVHIDGIGLQGHCSMDFPTVELMEEAILKFSSLGLQSMITEMDITVIPWPGQRITAEVSLSIEFQEQFNPYAEGLPEEANQALNDRYVDFFEMFLKHQDKISRVTLWGVHDGQSWRNDWPVLGRTDYPLLFDRDLEAKPAVQRLIELATTY